VLAASRAAAIDTAIDRTEEVLIGSAAALLVTLVAAVFGRSTARFTGDLRSFAEEAGD
jgi:hypothetical protein